MGPIPFEEWIKIEPCCTDYLQIRRNPQDPQEYGLDVEGNVFHPLILPRGTLPEIARGDLEHGRTILRNLDEPLLEEFHKRTSHRRGQRIPRDFFEYSLLAVIKTAYMLEEERQQV